MNSVAIRQGGSDPVILPASFAFPVMSPGLAEAVAAVRLTRAPACCERPTSREAGAHIPVWENACRPVEPDALVRWLKTISLASAAPLDFKEFERRAAAIADVLWDAPCAVFTRRSQAAFARQQKFFPGASGIRPWVVSGRTRQSLI